MSVYVDEIKKYETNLKYKMWCHLLTDGKDMELHLMAEKIGLQRKWFQSKSVPHYDLTPNKRKLAIKNGAITLDFEEMKRFVRLNYGKLRKKRVKG